ncbi:hypothetical protein FQN50_007195 [Emmonsiellopsis sp. PD_5]|nr:hypothetical protein FQN50_007195 [Emmonsiellopsis sp. PD_5]
MEHVSTIPLLLLLLRLLLFVVVLAWNVADKRVVCLLDQLLPRVYRPYITSEPVLSRHADDLLYSRQLCAIGTVGIAATGFALGRNDAPQIPPATSKRRRSIFRSSFSSPLARVFDVSSPSDAQSVPPSPGAPRPATSHIASPKRVDESLGSSRPGPPLPALEALKETAPDGVRRRPRRRTYMGPALKPGNESPVDPPLASPMGRPSSSWIRRISIISSSQNDSPLSTSRPDSPSVSSSTSPFFSSPFRLEPAPNKLVKRSASQRRLTNPNSTRPSATAAPAPFLRRPATSHQRLATMRQRSSTESRVLLGSPYSPTYSPHQLPADRLDPCVNEDWRPYFLPEHTSRSEMKRQASSRRRAHSPRRLVPNPDNIPTLLLASSITRDVSNCNNDDNDGWMLNHERPQTRGSIDSDVTTPDEQLPEPLSEPRPIPERRPRQSFSVGEMVSTSAPSPWKFSGTKSLGRHRGFSVSKEHSLEPPSPTNDLGAKFEGLNLNSTRLRKRRTITDSDIFQRPSTSSRAEFGTYPFTGGNQEEKSPKSRLRRLPRFSELRAELSLQLESTSRSSSGEQYSNTAGNGFSTSTAPRAQRLSAAASDPASTLVGSDNDTKVFSSGDEDETDFQSDTAFDSFPTRVGVTNPPTHRGPRIETIFDKPSSSELANGKLSVLEGLASDVTRSVVTSEIFPPKVDEVTVDKSIELPLRESKTLTQPHDLNNEPDCLVLSVQPSNDDSEIIWNSLSEIESMDDGDRCFPPTPPRQGLSLPRSSTARPHSSVTLDDTSGRDARLSLFDWSEAPRADKDNQDSDFRPKTVHGKQLADTRGGRTTARRGATAVHLRSQSVPISREPALSNDALSPKFGTWGLGNKGVSEDWDGDFEFDDSDKQDESKGDALNSNVVPGNQGMKVPQSIMERQASVHGQFGHVQELTLLVEELKRLRSRANVLNIVDGPTSDLWREAKGIINLATLEDDEDDENSDAQLPPTSPAFSAEDLDDDFFSTTHTKTQTSAVRSEKSRSPLSERTNSSPNTTPPPRARTDSSVKAKFVLDTIHQQRGRHDPIYVDTIDSQQKLPFDTQSLRDLVNRAGVVTRSLKEAVRKAEGVCLSSEAELPPQDPPFSQMFARPLSGSESCYLPGLALSKNVNGYRSLATGTSPNENDGCERMTMMTVV